MNQYITGTAIRNQREQRKMTQLEIATNGVFEENRKAKHERDAKNGWYRYDTRFALPVYGDDGNIERYNIFRGRLLIRHASSGRKYLYDILEIKKETGKSCQT